MPSHPRRTRPQGAPALVLLLLLLASLVLPASAAYAADDGPIGGPQLGTTGTVRSPGTPAVPAGVVAPSFVVADLDSGEVYAARNPHMKTLPASCLKTLTALVLIPRLDPDQVVTANDADASVDGTRVGIVPGGRYTVESLFQALLMMSGNDAAELLARTGQTRAQTLAQMNELAQRLHADDTFAATPSGLDGPNQSTSAYDLALINRQTMKLADFRRYIGTRTATFGAIGGEHFQIGNKNRLLLDNYPGALGGKDGYTDAAEHTFIGIARRDGRTFIVTMTRTDRTYGAQTEALLDWAFKLPADAQPVGELVAPEGDVTAASDRDATGERRSGGGASLTAATDRAARENVPVQVALSVAGVVLAGVIIGLFGRPHAHH